MEGYPLPEYLNDTKHDTFYFGASPSDSGVIEQVVNIMDRRALVVEFCKKPKTLKEIMQFLGLKHRPNFIENVLNPLLKAGLLKRTIPDKPRSKFQKYVITKGGR